MAPFPKEMLCSVDFIPHSSFDSSPSPSIYGLPPKEPLVRRAAHALKTNCLRFSDWLISWTPMLLVVGYYIVTTAIFVMCSQRAIQAFYYFFMIVNFYVACCCAIEAFLGMSPVREARKAAIKVEERGGQFPSPDADLPIIDMVIVAYLPNEKDIVKDQVMYALEELVYPRDKIRINLVYNTPRPIEPLESELHKLTSIYDHLRVIKVPHSTSKADNLNFFFTLDTGADVIGIFDCDHFPHPHNPRWAAERFLKDKTVDIVQGRCIVYNTKDSFWSKMIAIEFDKIYAISHPGRMRMFGFGLFCGSNGYWKADLLKGHKMHGEMLTEDIDSALRAYGAGKKAYHDMNVVSFEQAPTSFQSFWKQRMRWAQGWTQASVVHMPLIWNKPQYGRRSLNERFGITSLLLIRELSYYLVTMHTTLTISFIVNGWPHNVRGLVRLVFFQYPLAEWFLFATIAALAATLWFVNRVRSEFTSWRSMTCFSLIYPPYLMLLATMGLYGHARQIVKYSSWNPTARA